MLFKSKLYLSNCDSVRQLKQKDLEQRILSALLFADGVIVSPNVLIDTPYLNEILKQDRIKKYLNEEGWGKFVIRGKGLSCPDQVREYYDKLDDSFIVSSFQASPTKGRLTELQQIEINQRISGIEKTLSSIGVKFEPRELDKDSLKKEVIERLTCESLYKKYFKSDMSYQDFFGLIDDKKVVSRSSWYKQAKNSNAILDGQKLISEVIDPAYSSLFIDSGEGFIQDNLKGAQILPLSVLRSGLAVKAMRDEISYISEVYDIYETITSFGVNQLSSIVTDKALDFIEDKLADKGQGFLNRKNWFGMRDILGKKLGVEIK